MAVRAFPPTAFTVRAMGAGGGFDAVAPPPAELRVAAPAALVLDGSALQAGADGPATMVLGTPTASAPKGPPGTLEMVLGGCDLPRAVHLLVEETAAAASGAAWASLSDADLKLGAWCWNVTGAGSSPSPPSPSTPSVSASAPPPPDLAVSSPGEPAPKTLNPRDPCSRCLELHVEAEALPKCAAPPPPHEIHWNPPPPPPPTPPPPLTADGMPAARSGHSLTGAGAGGGAYLFGGLVSGGRSVDDLWLLHPRPGGREASWTRVHGPGEIWSPPARLGHAAAFVEGDPSALTARERSAHLLIFGGHNESGHQFNDLWSYVVDERWWHALQQDDVARPGQPSSRGGAALFVAAAGGGNSLPSPATPPPPEGMGSGVPMLFGGTFYGNLKNDVWALEPGGGRWVEVVRNSPHSAAPAPAPACALRVIMALALVLFAAPAW